MFRIIPLFFLFGMMLFYSCIFTYDPPDQGVDCLKIANSSNDVVYFLVTSEDSLQPEVGISLYELFRKEVFGVTIFDTLFEARILPRDTSVVCFHLDLGSKSTIDSTKGINVFYFDRNLLENYDWVSIAEHQYYNDMKHYSFEDLKATNWLITLE